MSAKHNPGPWHVHMHGAEPQVWAGRTLCVAKLNTALPMHEGNAALLAAAPEMLDALHEAHFKIYASEMPGRDALLAQITDVIAKAEGKP